MILTKKTSKQIFNAANNWAILDEIEAPMWADLVLECNSTYNDNDDEWFHISHPFHHSSAQELMSTFLGSAIKVQGPSSSKLPPSISKSRGNDHRNKKQEPVVCRVTLNKKIDSKSSRRKSLLTTNVRCKEGTKSNTSVGKVIDHLNSKPVVCGGESNLTSTISSESKLIEVSSQPSGLTSDLLSTLRVSIRKSLVTRQASRGQIKGTRQSESRKSYSTKSSVGSSTVTENIEKTPESRNVMSTSQLQTKKVNRPFVQKQPAAKAMDHKACISSTRARGINHSSRNVDSGKENHAGKTILNRKSSTITREAEGAVQDPKVVKRNSHQKNDRSKLVGAKENGNTGNKLTKSSRKVETVYFR